MIIELAQCVTLAIVIICGIANTHQIKQLTRRVEWLEDPEPGALVDLDSIRAEVERRKYRRA